MKLVLPCGGDFESSGNFRHPVCSLGHTHTWAEISGAKLVALRSGAISSERHAVGLLARLKGWLRRLLG